MIRGKRNLENRRKGNGTRLHYFGEGGTLPINLWKLFTMVPTHWAFFLHLITFIIHILFMLVKVVSYILCMYVCIVFHIVYGVVMVRSWSQSKRNNVTFNTCDIHSPLCIPSFDTTKLLKSTAGDISSIFTFIFYNVFYIIFSICWAHFLYSELHQSLPVMIHFRIMGSVLGPLQTLFSIGNLRSYGDDPEVLWGKVLGKEPRCFLKPSFCIGSSWATFAKGDSGIP